MTETRPAACERAQWLIAAMDAIRAHLSVCRVAVPAGVNVGYANEITVLLATGSLRELASGLLSWADTLSEVTAKVSRTSAGRVLVSITGETALGIQVFVYDGTDYDPAAFGEMRPSTKRAASLDELRSWAIGAAEVQRHD